MVACCFEPSLSGFDIALTLRNDELFRHEDVLARELLEERGLLGEVRRQNIDRIAGDPLRQVNRLVMAVVEDDQDARLPAADVFDRMPEPLRDVADVALAESLLAPAPVRAEQRHEKIARKHVLPFARVRMPVELAQR